MQLDLGTRIRYFRRRDGRTQEALAQALGVSSQAVSRWESGGSYPDMNLLPSIANYFGVSIDELFGYDNERSLKVDLLVSRIRDLMPWSGKHADSTADECIALARDSLIEFPGNAKLMLCLATALFQAGYVRCGEHHMTDDEGYSIYDTARHRNCAEWKKAIPLYEKVLAILPAGDLRNQAVAELSQLYLNMGEYDQSMTLAESAPDLLGSKELLRLKACDGKKQAQVYGKTILSLIRTSAELMIQGVIQNGKNMTAEEKVLSIRGAIALFDQVCTDGNYCDQNPLIGKMYMLLSLYLWLADQHDEAFSALDRALAHFKMYGDVCAKKAGAYSAPLLRLVTVDMQEILRNDHCEVSKLSGNLPEDWPWWHVPEEDLVRSEMQSDPRWEKWVAKTKA